MPLAGFADFDALVKHLEEVEGYSHESALKIAGKIKAEKGEK